MTAFIAPAIAGIGSLIGGAMSRHKTRPQETKMQGKQRELVDQLLSSLSGEGPYSDLFNADEDTFKRSYIDPAQSRFKTQTAPMIQQAAIAGGQQRGSGIQDTLTRAGVDMDMLLNQQYGQFQQQAQDRRQNIIGNILSMGPGAQNDMPSQGYGQAAGQGLMGYLTSSGFGNMMNTAGGSFANKNNEYSQKPAEKGFADRT